MMMRGEVSALSQSDQEPPKQVLATMKRADAVDGTVGVRCGGTKCRRQCNSCFVGRGNHDLDCRYNRNHHPAAM